MGQDNRNTAGTGILHRASGQEAAILVLVLVIVGVAVFCFSQGYIAAGIICLAGFSKRFGFVALIVTSLVLFANKHWIVGPLPILLIVWNLIGLRLLRGPGVFKDALAEDDPEI